MHEGTRYLLSLVGATILVVGTLILTAPAQEVPSAAECACVVAGECEATQAEINQCNEIYDCNPQLFVCTPKPPQPAIVNTPGSGSPDVFHNIGRCVWTDFGARWQCKASHPVFPNPEAEKVRECVQTSTETPESCLRAWAERTDITICGPVAPGTGSLYLPGSGTVEVPYQNDAARELNRYEAAYQCAGEIALPPNGARRWSPYRFR